MTASLPVLRWRATLAFLFVALIGGLVGSLVSGGRAFFWGLSVAALLEIPSYWALSLTLRLSNGKFFAALVGGMLGRLLFLGTCVGILHRCAPGSVMAFVLAAVAGLVGFSFVELFFIGRQNRLPL